MKRLIRHKLKEKRRNYLGGNLIFSIKLTLCSWISFFYSVSIVKLRIQGNETFNNVEIR